MEKKLYAIDIETATQGRASNIFTDGDYYKAPSNFKDPEKIEANINQQKEKARDKHALYWWTGKVISLSIIDVFGDEEDKVFYGHNEATILKQAFDVFDRPRVYLIGKSSNNFDFPFMIGRYLANKQRVPAVLRKRYSMFDTDNFFGFSAASGQRSKLDTYAYAIGMDSKPMHGSQVGELYNSIIAAEMAKDLKEANRLWKKLADYNLFDSEVVSNLAKGYWNNIEEVE
jgi:hypothetical protein